MSSILRFSIDGDIHANIINGTETLRKGERDDYPLRLTRLNNYYPLDFHLALGDLTENGYGASGCSCFGSAPRPNQVRVLHEKYVQPIRDSGITTYMTLGNHDMGSTDAQNYVAREMNCYNNLIFDRWSSSRYDFHHKNVHFISLGIYPTASNRKWLSTILGDDLEQPRVIFYHYNTCTEPYSDFWTQKDKDAFGEVIRGYNILCICNGHYHASQYGKWKGIPVIKGSGSTIAFVEIEEQKLKGVYFTHADGEPVVYYEVKDPIDTGD